MIKQLFYFALLSIAIIQLYNKATDGFSLSQISSFLPQSESFNAKPLPDDQRSALLDSLNQPFYYLGKGCQFYAFGSQDEQYVIKLLKQKHLRYPSPIFKKSLQKRKERVEKLFSSILLSFEELNQESGLVYVHLNKVPDLQKKVTLIDKVGLRHEIQIDDYEFIIQKRAQTAKEVFAKATQEEAKKRIEQLCALVHARCSKKIRDGDRSFVQNIGFFQDRAVYIDVGQMFKDESISEQSQERADLESRLGNLRFWLEKYHPQFNHLIDLVRSQDPILSTALSERQTFHLKPGAADPLPICCCHAYAGEALPPYQTFLRM